MHRLAAFAAVITLATAWLPCAAAPFALQLGPDRIVLDTPAGMSDTLPLASPRLNELAESLTSASNRILLFGVTDLDFRRFSIGDRPDLKRYLIIAIPRGLERERITPEQFTTFVADGLRDLGTVPKEGDMLKYLDAQPRGKASLLAELRRDDSIVSVLQGSRLPDSSRFSFTETPQYLLSSTTLVRLRGKALNLSVYAGYESPADFEWIRFITARWIDDLLRLNEQRP
jgi:hypothetical protein